ncbi:transposase [Nonomuraea sp. NPDC049421]|uniref:transposase n=1 Tax=Nonomuraea sp. NPDC049421 TaxID=3155275 RepID=UPI003424424E
MVPTICQAIVAEYAGAGATCPPSSWTTCSWRHLTSRCTGGQRAEPILAAWGLRPPLLIVRRGARADQRRRARLVPTSAQRCLVHRARNVLAEVSTGDQAEVKVALWNIFDLTELGDDIAPGEQLVAHLRRDPPPRQGHRPLSRRNQLRLTRVGRPRPRRPRLVRLHHDQQGPAHPARPRPGPMPPAQTAPPDQRPSLGTRHRGRPRSTAPTSSSLLHRFEDVAPGPINESGGLPT